MAAKIPGLSGKNPVSSLPSTKEAKEGKGALAFAWEKIKEFGEAFLICITLLTLVLPVISYIENKTATNPHVLPEPAKKLETEEALIYNLWILINTHIDNVRKNIKADNLSGHELNSVREKNENSLSEEVRAVLKRYKIPGHFWGTSHKTAQSVVYSALILHLKEAKNRKEQEEILLAYGYEEDEFRHVLQKTEYLKSQAFH